MSSGGHFGDRGFSNQLWEKCWECSVWEKKRANAYVRTYTKEPELLLQYRAVEVYRKAVKLRLLQCHFQNGVARPKVRRSGSYTVIRGSG